MTRLAPYFEKTLRDAAAGDLAITTTTDAHGVSVVWCELARNTDLVAVASRLRAFEARLAMITASQPKAPEEEEDEQDEENSEAGDVMVRATPVTFGGTPLDGTSYEVIYHFILADEAVNLIAHAPANGSLASLTPLFRPADWPEREIMELYGLTFTGHPDPRRLFLDNSIEPSVFERLIPFSTLVNAASTDDLWKKVHAASKATATEGE